MVETLVIVTWNWFLDHRRAELFNWLGESYRKGDERRVREADASLATQQTDLRREWRAVFETARRPHSSIPYLVVEEEVGYCERRSRSMACGTDVIYSLYIRKTIWGWSMGNIRSSGGVPVDRYTVAAYILIPI